jgi:hypothetical protein
MEADGEDKDFINALPDDFFDNLESEECELDAGVLARRKELEASERFVEFWSNATDSEKLEFERPAHAHPLPTTSATERSELDPSLPIIGIAVRHLFRATKRKAGKARPNCFGSKYLHDAASVDCRACKFSEGCKKTIVDEIPVLEAAGNAHKAHLKPAADLTQLESQRIFMRERCLREYRKSRKRRRQKDLVYRRDMRANPKAEIRIKAEAQKRLVALRSATANPRGDKRLEQLLGREESIIDVWIAREHAILAYGPNVSDAQAAKCFEELGGWPFQPTSNESLPTLR